MKKTLYNLSLVLIIAGSFGCSAPDSKNEALTTEETTENEHNSTTMDIDSSAKLEIQDTVGVESAVKALSNEVDSLLKDI